MTAEEMKKLIEIAQESILGMEGRHDLDAKNSDGLDFLNVSVWELKDALIAAYELGKASK